MSQHPEYAPFLDGERLFLRELRPEDANPDYYRWMSDYEVVRYTESRFAPPSLEGLREFVMRQAADPAVVFLAIVAKDSGRHIGNLKLGPINWLHRLGDVGIIVGEKQYWGKGYAAEAIRLLAGFALGRLGLHKLTASCYADNLGSIKTFEKAGFTIEGTRPRHFHLDGRWVDLVQLGMWRE